ncbi:hypothetical protein KO525_15805 [Psychrosphaera sp. B3R10]|nr:hypothetical protein [Psychrosphaera sp. I2R16]MBU2990857.1 hypothetical protein [Psychrosphaera sp. B3R10]
MNVLLVFSGILSAVAALLHLGCIYFGAPWYRIFGAGEQMAQLAEQGSLQPTIITSGITMVLAIWSLYAFSAAGIIGKLPFMRLALVTITALYLCRGIVGLFLIFYPIGRTPQFWLWSSAICLLIGVVHLLGVKQQWRLL